MFQLISQFVRDKDVLKSNFIRVDWISLRFFVHFFFAWIPHSCTLM